MNGKTESYIYYLVSYYLVIYVCMYVYRSLCIVETDAHVTNSGRWSTKILSLNLALLQSRYFVVFFFSFQETCLVPKYVCSLAVHYSSNESQANGYESPINWPGKGD